MSELPFACGCLLDASLKGLLHCGLLFVVGDCAFRELLHDPCRGRFVHECGCIEYRAVRLVETHVELSVRACGHRASSVRATSYGVDMKLGRQPPYHGVQAIESEVYADA